MSKYANPLYNGLGSDDRSCAKVIKRVLDVLAYPVQRFDNPPLALPSNVLAEENSGISFEHDCGAFRKHLFQSLTKSGWLLHYDEHGLTVRRERQ